MNPNAWKAEFLGTFLLILCGLSAVAISVTYPGSLTLPGVAAVWAAALAMCIALAQSSSGAHFNPAITVALVVLGRYSPRILLPYLSAQFSGATLGALLVFALYSPSISRFELKSGIVRGESGSEASGMIFAEFFPNPSGQPLPDSPAARVGPLEACVAECVGTCLLSLAACGLSHPACRGQGPGMGSIWMGGVLFVLICMMGPLTMGCFNPARDIGPRLVGVLGGWGEVAWGWRDGWWVVVYVVSPVSGALMGALVSKWLFKDAGIVPDSGGAGHAT